MDGGADTQKLGGRPMEMVELRERLARIEQIVRGHDKEHQLLAEKDNIAVRELDRRLEQLNELRKDVVEDRTIFLRRETFDSHEKESGRRLANLESGKLAVSDAEKIELRLSEIERRGSDQARQALKEITEMQTKVSALQLDTASRGAVEDNRQELQRYRNRSMWMIIGTIFAVLGTIASVILAILTYAKK